MDAFAQLPAGERRIYFEQTAARMGVSPQIVEKDFWVCWTLKQLFTLPDIGPHLIFKGGTSLSKAFKLIERFADHRKNRRRFGLLTGLPSDSRTLANLKIYFMAHLGLDWEIIRDERVNFYGLEEQCYELTEAGVELVGTILNEEWPHWKRSSPPPTAKAFGSIAEYFESGVGAACPGIVFERDSKLVTLTAEKISEGVLTPEDVESLRNLPKRSFKEGQRKLVTHVKAERNQALVREAKRHFKNLHGRLYCEACGFEFLTRYGERGRDFIEAHHSKPISTLGGSVPTTINDLEMVCSNCHRMLHRKPWISVEVLRDSL